MHGVNSSDLRDVYAVSTYHNNAFNTCTHHIHFETEAVPVIFIAEHLHILTECGTVLYLVAGRVQPTHVRSVLRPKPRMPLFGQPEYYTPHALFFINTSLSSPSITSWAE